MHEQGADSAETANADVLAARREQSAEGAFGRTVGGALAGRFRCPACGALPVRLGARWAAIVEVRADIIAA